MSTSIPGVYAAGDICTYEGKVKLIDRKSVVQGKSVDLGGRRIIKKKKEKKKEKKIKKRKKKNEVQK